MWYDCSYCIYQERTYNSDIQLFWVYIHQQKNRTTDLGCILADMQITMSEEGRRKFTSMNIWFLVNNKTKC